jgi:hypothetical protein
MQYEPLNAIERRTLLRMQRLIQSGQVGLQAMPIWVCFGPWRSSAGSIMLKPRAIYLAKPENAEAWAMARDEDSAISIETPKDQRRAKRLGYCVIEMRAARAGGPLGTGGVSKLLEFGKVGAMKLMKRSKHIAAGTLLHKAFAIAARERKGLKPLKSEDRQARKFVELGRPSGMGVKSFIKAAKANTKQRRASMKSLLAMSNALLRKMRPSKPVPVWICFGPDGKPRLAYLHASVNGEGWSAFHDGAIKTKLGCNVFDQRKAKKLGYVVKRMEAR